MKVAAKILGILGGLFSLIMVIAAFTGDTSKLTFGFITIGPIDKGMVWLAVIAISGLLAIAGGVLVDVSDGAAGVLMIIACVLGGMNILFLLGGIFALCERQTWQFPGYPQQVRWYTRKAAMALGITGGVIPLILLTIVIITRNNPETPVYGVAPVSLYDDSYSVNGTIPLGLLLGFIGGFLARQDNSGAGIFMIIGSLFAGLNLVLLIGGILALSGKPKAAVYPAYKYPQYPVYPQYPQYPVYPNQQQYTQQYPVQYPQDDKKAE